MTMPRIKVAFFADMLVENFDGAARTIFQIIHRIDTSKYEYFFMCGNPPKGNFPFKYYVVPSFEIPKNEDYKIAIPALSFFEMNNAMLIFKPDVIHISSPSFLGRYAIDYALSHDIPAITIYHTHFISYIDYYFKDVRLLIDTVKAFVISRNRSLYNHCDIMLIPSNTLMEELAQYEFEVHKMRLWRRGMNTTLFSPDKKDQSILKDLPSDKPVVLFVSRLVWEKNLQTLIDIYVINEKNGRPFELVIAGDGVAHDELVEKMPQATFLGNLSHDKLSVWYSSADVFLFTSDTETYGNVVIEAMASGLPVVVADAGGPKDLVDHNINGLKCNAHDAQDFYEAINTLINDKEKAAVIRETALNFARSLNWDVLVSEYFTMIDELYHKKQKKNH
jgi:glycosyltransferase involved in cell wall biosynthesis